MLKERGCQLQRRAVEVPTHQRAARIFTRRSGGSSVDRRNKFRDGHGSLRRCAIHPATLPFPAMEGTTPSQKRGVDELGLLPSSLTLSSSGLASKSPLTGAARLTIAACNGVCGRILRRQYTNILTLFSPAQRKAGLERV